jgi:YebC/PmpR family DNA-binding regulatory protein
MAGHSKWSNIKHRKGAQDKKRGKIFSKIAKEIAVAVKMGGADATANSRLRLALTKARSANMPRDNIERAVKKGSGDMDAASFSEKVYEGYGPGGVAVIVECLTDNVNRTVGDVRHGFTKFGGNLGTEGSVAWMFKKLGQIVYDRKKIESFDTLFEKALEAGADDVEESEEMVEVRCDWTQFSELKEMLDELGAEPELAEISQIPENYTEITEDQETTLQKLVDRLEDLDDVQSVFHNAQLGG